ncbi:hypothetical protein Tco_0342670, partial [Tanacetum coccineum]
FISCYSDINLAVPNTLVKFIPIQEVIQSQKQGLIEGKNNTAKAILSFFTSTTVLAVRGSTASQTP